MTERDSVTESPETGETGRRRQISSAVSAIAASGAGAPGFAVSGASGLQEGVTAGRPSVISVYHSCVYGTVPKFGSVI